jgi:hypothetical protein
MITLMGVLLLGSEVSRAIPLTQKEEYRNGANA